MIWGEMSYYRYKRQDNLHDIYEPDVFDIDEQIEIEMIRDWAYDSRMGLSVDGTK